MTDTCQECGKPSIFPKHYTLPVCVACRTRQCIANGTANEIDPYRESKELSDEEIEEVGLRRREVDAVNFLAARLGVTSDEVWRRLR